MPAIPALSQPLPDGRVSLRVAAERDIPEILIAYEDDPQLHLRLGEDRPPTGAQLGTANPSAAEADRAAGRLVRLTIVEPGSDDCRGQIDVHERRLAAPARGARDLGRAATPPARARHPRAAAERGMAVSGLRARAPRRC